MKLFVFLAIVVSLWYVMRWFQQVESERRLHRDRTRERGDPTARKVPRATDTIVCVRCGSYVPADHPTACEKKDCPFPGVG